mmetsp:Transcript_31516/g.46000  ORF Transcript_31516/g.46000 Transcript_31516/m.46000 type:complete len:229 (-) Transcript_31516:605-1291(-)
MLRWHGLRKLSRPTPPLRDGRSSSSPTHPPTDLVSVSSRRTTLSMDAAGSTTPTISSAVSSSSSYARTVVSRPGSLDISILDRTTKIPSPSPRLTPRMVLTPTVVHAHSCRPLSCAEEPLAMDVSSLVLYVVTRMDSRSAPWTTRRTEKSALTPRSPIVTATTRLEYTHMRIPLRRTTTISRFTSHLLEITFTPLMMDTADTMRKERLLSMRRLPWTLWPGGTWPVAA